MAVNTLLYKDLLILVFGNSENASYFKKYYGDSDSYKQMRNDYLKISDNNEKFLISTGAKCESTNKPEINQEIVTLERLIQYANTLNDYRELVLEKSAIMRSVGVLKSKDYSNSKITASNAIKTSIQERYVIKLEKLNKQIAEFRAWIIPEQEIIKNHIDKISKFKYKQLLIMRYIYHFKWSKIREELFGCAPDFEEEKNDKYKDKAFYWHRAALAELENVNKRGKLEALMVTTLNKALNGDIKAVQFIRDTIGEMPTLKQDITQNQPITITVEDEEHKKMLEDL